MYKEPRATESVLGVDDSATVREFMRVKLAPFRFAVDYAENGAAAAGMTQTKHRWRPSGQAYQIKPGHEK